MNIKQIYLSNLYTQSKSSSQVCEIMDSKSNLYDKNILDIAENGQVEIFFEIGEEAWISWKSNMWNTHSLVKINLHLQWRNLFVITWSIRNCN